jgi:hypothetical protein
MFLFQINFDEGAFDTFIQYVDRISIIWVDNAINWGWLFFSTLVVLDLAWSGWRIAINDQFIGGIKLLVLRLVAHIITATIILNFKSFILFDQASELASFLSGQRQVYSPSNFFGIGWNFLIGTMASGSWTDFVLGGGWFFSTIATILGFIPFLIISFAFVKLKVEIIFISAICPIFLSLAPFHVTRVFTTKYMSYLLKLLIKTFVFYLVLFLIFTLMEDMDMSFVAESINNEPDYLDVNMQKLLLLLFMGLFLVKLPEVISNKLTSEMPFDIFFYYSLTSKIEND